MRKAVLITLAALAICCNKTPTSPVSRTDVRAVALLVVGDVKAGGRPLKSGAFIQSNEELLVGPASMLDLQIKGTQATMRIKENSAVQMTALLARGRTQYSVHVSSGRVMMNVPRRKSDEDFRVVTPAAIASVRGTKFDVFVFSNGTSRTVVFDGSVATRVRIDEVESLPPELLENSQALRKVVSILEEKERVVEAGQEITVTHYVVEADLKAKIEQIRTSDAVKGALNRPLTQEEARNVSQQIDRDLSDRLGEVQSEIQKSYPDSKVEIRERAATPPEGYPTEQEFDEFKPLPPESVTEEKAAETVARRNMETQVRQQLMVRIEKVTGGKLDSLSLKNGRTVTGAVRQMGEDYLVTTPEGNEMVSGSDVAEIRF